LPTKLELWFEKTKNAPTKNKNAIMKKAAIPRRATLLGFSAFRRKIGVFMKIFLDTNINTFREKRINE
jgi:hypothetical protein